MKALVVEDSHIIRRAIAKVLVVSGDSSMSAGADACLTKPFKLDMFLQKLDGLGFVCGKGLADVLAVVRGSARAPIRGRPSDAAAVSDWGQTASPIHSAW